MRRNLGPFLIGFVTAIVALVVGGYLFIKAGGISMDTAAKPLPFEATVAGMAIDASVRSAANLKSPLTLTDANLIEGAREYRQSCAICHSTPGQPHTAIAHGMFPDPPELFKSDEMVTGDPEGITFWKITHGIRLSGMPGFGPTLSDTTRWQLTMLVAHADKLSPAVQAALEPSH
jgi:mono/diheme cytochrome c family protein